MNKERNPLTLAKMHELGIKKVMDSIDHLDALVYKCDKRSVLEMLDVSNGLSRLSYRNIIGGPGLVIANKRLRDIGEKFKARCSCTK